ncbi:MAG: lysine transporter LysE [Candidatus Marinimicrobia bacterium]|nr:lysine transporter LysE [Candidatus Neomarinimicrobiota bacterium]
MRPCRFDSGPRYTFNSIFIIEQFLPLIIIHFLAVISPGPDFVIVTSQSIKYGRITALKTSLGISLGISIHVLYCIFGLDYIFINNNYFYNIIKYLSFAYLLFLSISLINTKYNNKNTLPNNSLFNLKNPFLIGFLTNVLNPKAILFFVSLFTIFVNQSTSIYIKSIYGIWMVLSTGVWFCIVSVFFTSKYSKKIINKYSIIISKIMGIILLVISIKVIL